MRGWQTFSLKGQRVNILSFADHNISVATTEPCHYSTKAVIDSMSTGILYLQNTKMVWHYGSFIPSVPQELMKSVVN